MCITHGKEEPGEGDSEINVSPVVKKQDPVSECKKTIKRDKSNYPILDEDKMWLVFHQKFLSLPTLKEWKDK